MNSLPFTATIIDSESNIPIKNGVMHVIRGIIIYDFSLIKLFLFQVFYPERRSHLKEFLHQYKELGNNHCLFYFSRILFIIFSGFAQLLQQTGVIEQLKQAGRSYTLFIPTNAALQSIGVTTNVNRLRQVNIYLFANLAKSSFFILLVCSSSYMC